VALVKDSLQDPAELAAFIDLLNWENVRSYLEVGANAGGTFKRIGMALPQSARLVALDIAGKSSGRLLAMDMLKEAVADLKRSGRDAHVVFGNSRDPKIVSEVLDLSPFDCVLIDGDHSLPGVTADFDNYRPMARMIAFHDISWRRAGTWTEGQRIWVPEFWESIKGSYRHEEIRLCPTGKNNGIGVLWRS
jgi:hypothetical protein